jgi:NAD(P)-dependent dehydrogenase (short-subunit alcohol dehydrogenase family)
MGEIDLNGRNILVTGGSQGIGASAVVKALESGANVVFCARTATDVTAAEARYANDFGARRVAGIAADVSDPTSVEAALDAVRERFGALHGVIHAAAILGPIGNVLDVEPQAWLRTLEINLYGTFLVVRAAWRTMRRSGGGRIAVFSGGGAATPFPRYTAYACSKVGVVRFVESVAIEMAEDRVAINAIAPGFVATRMHRETLAAGEAAGRDYLARTKADLEKGGVPAELGAEAACFFISDAAAGITGRFAAAPWDDWRGWPERLEELRGSDFFTLRRILPRDRGSDWQ